MYLIGRLILMACAALIGYCVVMIGIRFSVLAGLICLVYVTKTGGLFKVKRFLFAHGTARWADSNDLKHMIGAKDGLMIGQLNEWQAPSVLKGMMGLMNPFVRSADACHRFLGALFRKPRKSAPMVRLVDAVHTAVIAPSGIGKGVSFVVPFLLDCRDSCVVVDFKGELARLTAKHRREKLGHRIVMLDPFKLVTDSPDTFNPLDFISKSKDDPIGIDHCRELAETQILRTGMETESHWMDVAEHWIASAIATVVEYGDPDDRSLQTARELLTDPARIESLIKLMRSSNAWGGMLARMGHQLTHFKDKELGSTLTSANRFLRYLDTIAVAASTRTSTFNPSELLDGKTTMYFVLPPEHARTQSPLLRMWIGAMFRACIQGGLQERTKVHFVLDEASSLGHMEQIDDAIDKYRGYGVRLLFFYQSLGQLKKCFPDGQDQTFLSGVSKVFFGTSDPQTADFVSNCLGDETIIVESGGVSHARSIQTSSRDNDSSSTSRTDSDNWAQQGRRLLKPEEVLALSPRTAITFAPGVCPRPICTTLTRYYENKPSFRGYLRQASITLAISFGLFLGFGLLALFLSGALAPPPEPQW
jgi:type IV secretion system protein VirD4